MDYKNDIGFRKQRLIKLRDTIILYDAEITQALYDDFGKPAFEAYATETSIVLSELRVAINNIHKWSKRKRVFPWIPNFPTSDYIYKEPFGSVLIIAPWNYPFLLAMSPLIAAVAAGNSVTLKPSELTPKTAALISEIIRVVFDPNHVEVYIGGPEVSQRLLTHRWDYIFFTGSVGIRKIVAKAAAENLTPVTLELGGKNPCIVHKSANLKLAAKRICWGKFLNAGQTCIAPDYILVDQSVKKEFIELLKAAIEGAYGSADVNLDFPRIINERNFKRLVSLLDGQELIYGGNFNEASLYFEPSLVNEPSLESNIMQDEIFGPILPVISYTDEDQIARIIKTYEKPLSLYVFAEDRKFAEQMITGFSFGGGCVNDTLIHFSNSRLPFGGIGNSGNRRVSWKARLRFVFPTIRQS